MRRHVLGVLASVVLISVACGGGDDDAGPGAGAAGQAGASGSAGSGGATPKGAGAIFSVLSDVEAYGAGCSVDGQTLDGECFSSFFDHPFPSDFRRDKDGMIRTKGYPNPLSLVSIKNYIDVADRLTKGFSPQGSGFLRFYVPLDPASLPKSPKDTLSPSSSVQLIDVDPASPERGQRRLVDVYFREAPGVYWQPDTLAFHPVFGFPLRRATRYALVVTSAAKSKSGAPLTRPPELDQVLGLAEASGPAAALAADWAGAIAETGVAKEDIVHLTVFTTDDPTEELYRVRDFVKESYPAPTAKDWKVGKKSATSIEFTGNYGPSPDFQKGKIPFQNLGDGGAFSFAGDGTPKVEREFDLRFSLTVPDAAKCPMPAAGYPIVLYAHGTGGDYESYRDDGTADALAEQCLASMGIDQIFHGTRPGAPTGPDAEMAIQLLFFNFENPVAARTNGRQAAIDEVQRARLFTESHLKVPASVSPTGADIELDGSKLMFFGHSQGGLNGPLYLACDDSARGGVLSGSGSVISITLLEKTKPSPSVAAVVRSTFLGLKPPEYEELNTFHPAISLAQGIVDALDPIHYVGDLVRHPREGFAPKSIYQTEGVNPDFSGDNYTPPHAIEVQATATGLPLQTPIVHPVLEMSYAPGFDPVTIPPGGLSGNLAGGQASGVLAQWAPQGTDGHFVVFHGAARTQAAAFCKNLADDPKGRVPAP